GPDTGTYIGVLGDWAHPYPLLAKFRDEARQRAQSATQVKDGRVAPHLLAKGFQYGFGIRDLTHATSSMPQGANTSCKASSGFAHVTIDLGECGRRGDTLLLQLGAKHGDGIVLLGCLQRFARARVGRIAALFGVDAPA